MKRNAIETVLGAVVIMVAVFFLAFSYKTGNVSNVSGYKIVADFSDIGGLQVGDDVQISGVKVGQVANIALDPKAYLARVTIDIARDVKLPTDTAALISSTSLLGGKYMLLEPGGAEDFMADGGRIEFTQAPQNLEQLLGKFIFSVSDNKSSSSDETAPASEAPIGTAVDAADDAQIPAIPEATQPVSP